MARVQYHLPEDRIALAPTAVRGQSKLLVVDMGLEGDLQLQDSNFGCITSHIPPNAHLVMNNSRVIEARLYGLLDGEGHPIEVMLLQPDGMPPATAMGCGWLNQKWQCMIRATVPADSTLTLEDGVRLKVVSVHAEWDEEGEDNGVEATVEFEHERIAQTDWQLAPAISSMAELLTQIGNVPIPPYLRREAVSQDTEDYQTVYASSEAVGSVAAPTAGLHFTRSKLDELQASGVTLGAVSLHVSAGTFKPVEVGCISEHQMHWESFEASTSELQSIADSVADGRPLVAVGTTSVRLTESLYWLGARAILSEQSSMELAQWDPAQIRADFAKRGLQVPSVAESFTALIDRTTGGNVVGSTSMCCTPGYEFMVCREGLLTNFHQPDSTLMLLVAGYLGNEVDAGVDAVQSVYKHAIENDYRFLSYGDACLIKPRAH